VTTPSPKFNLKFYQAWKQKGVYVEDKQWSYYKPMDDTPVITCWHTILGPEGQSEVIKDAETGRMMFDAPGGDWVKKDKGKQYIALVSECIVHDKVAEVILLCGERSETEAHKVYAAAICDDLFYIKFTSVDKEGNISGYFLTKDMK
jgi:hypothetical protein